MRSRLTHKTSTAFPLALLSILFCVIGTQAQSRVCLSRRH